MSDVNGHKVYMVTVKIPKNPDHDPRNKITGPCPVTGTLCTDVTGEHHTFLMESRDGIDSVTTYARQRYGHVTRVEVDVFTTL